MRNSPDRELVRPNGFGHPPEFVVARLKGRHAALLADWRARLRARTTSGLSDEQVWSRLLEELAWLHGQVDARTRQQLAPLFALYELKTVTLALRSVASDRPEMVGATLGHSLLADPIQRVFRRAADVPAVLTQLGADSMPAASLFEPLPDAYARGGLRAVEDSLFRHYLEALDISRLRPALRVFFAAFIDARNLVLVFKHVRWHSTTPFSAIRGGDIAAGELEAIAARDDLAGLAERVQRFVGRRQLAAPSTDASLEGALFESITRRLRTYRRGLDVLAVSTAYIWRAYLQARNLALLVHATAVAPEQLERELIA